jgi:predicted permease
MKEFGNVALAKEECRDARRTRFFENLFQDIRYGLRGLLRRPGFTAVAILTLALGIGANTAIFSVVNAVLIRPLPFADSGKLMLVFEGLPDLGFQKMNFSAPDLQLYQSSQQSFEATASFLNKGFEISGAGTPERVIGARGSWNLFDLLGVQPVLGRTFTRDEDSPGHNVAILSYAQWQSKFSGASDAIGKTIDLDRSPYTVVGVLPRDFRFPLPGMMGSNSPAAVWVPTSFTPDELNGWGRGFNNDTIGRLKPGVTPAAAQAEANALAARIKAGYPAQLLQAFHNPTLNLSIAPMQGDTVKEIKPLLLMLQVAVALVLLIACANVALLLLARASGRSREIAIRAALGAGRGRLVMQLFTESFVLAAAGAGPGLALAIWCKNALLTFLPSSISLPKVSIDARVLIFTLAVAIGSAVLFGLAPAFEATRNKVQSALQEGGRSASISGARHRLQNCFIVAEFALALILMTGAGLLLRSFSKLLATNPGFEPQHVLVMSIPLPAQAYPKAAQIRSFYEQAIAKATQLPGVISAGVTNDRPLNSIETDSMTVEGAKEGNRDFPAVKRTWVLGDYLRTMGIPLIRGRGISAEDQLNTQRIAVISENLARSVWPNGDAIGNRVRLEGADAPWTTIVGIVGDVPDRSLAAKPEPHVYTPYLQEADVRLEDSVTGELRWLTLSARTQGDPKAVGSAVADQIHTLDSSLAVGRLHTMESDIAENVAPQRFNATLVGIYASVALLLALVGIYGVLAYTVTQQMHDIGVRIALGAQRSDILALVLRHGLKLAAIGTVIGLCGAWGITRLMASLLYGVTPRDPATFAGVTLVMAFTALLACYVPARRATRVDPIIALRHE